MINFFELTKIKFRPLLLLILLGTTGLLQASSSFAQFEGDALPDKEAKNLFFAIVEAPEAHHSYDGNTIYRTPAEQTDLKRVSHMLRYMFPHDLKKEAKSRLLGARASRNQDAADTALHFAFVLTPRAATFLDVRYGLEHFNTTDIATARQEHSCSERSNRSLKNGARVLYLFCTLRQNCLEADV